MDLFACVIEMLNLAIWNVKVFSLGNTWSCIHIYFFVVGESGNQLCLMYYSYVVNDIFDVIDYFVFKKLFVNLHL